jgi:hypothetical protein
VNPAAYALTSANSGFDGGRITRRVDSSRDLQIIASGAINTGKLETDGIDANFSYLMETSDTGAFIFSGRLNWIREFLVSDFPGGQPDFDAAGFTNNDPTRRLSRSMPDLRGNVAVNWIQERHSAGLNMRYVGAYTDNGAANNIIGDGKLDAYYAFDASYSYTVELASGEVMLTLGAIDLFDEDLPQLKNTNGTDFTVFDPRGRRVFASVAYSL